MTNDHQLNNLSNIYMVPESRCTHLREEEELINAKGPGGGKSFEGEVDGGGAMSVPAASLPAIGAGLVLVGEDGDLAAVQEL